MCNALRKACLKNPGSPTQFDMLDWARRCALDSLCMAAFGVKLNAIDDPESPVGERKRPGSGGSMASFALSHTLKRSESTAGSTIGSGGRWGSVVSGFWSSRRDSSTDDSDVFITPESPRKQVFPRHEHQGSLTGLDRMVEEVEVLVIKVILSIDVTHDSICMPVNLPLCYRG